MEVREMVTLQVEIPRRINTSEEGKRKVNAENQVSNLE